jgi:hypothetical protein
MSELNYSDNVVFISIMQEHFQILIGGTICYFSTTRKKRPKNRNHRTFRTLLSTSLLVGAGIYDINKEEKKRLYSKTVHLDY